MHLWKNIIAGLANSAVVGLVSIAAIPFYLGFLGVEAIGLIGLLAALQAMMSLLDLGFSPTVNREVAIGQSHGDLSSARHLLQTLEAIAWPVSAFFGCVLIFASSFVAGYWLNVESLSTNEVANAVAWMAGAVACRLPAGIYLGAINGAQRAALSSSVTSIHAIASAGGAVCLLALFSPSIVVLFAWHSIAALGYTLALRSLAWRTLGGRSWSTPDLAELRRVWRFSVGVGLIAVSSVVFTQADKLILSKMLSLDAFGRYALASIMAAGVYSIAVPIFNVIYPRFSWLVAGGDFKRLVSLYSLATKAAVILIFSVVMILVLFADYILSIWTRDPALASAARPIVQLLVIGSAIHSVMYFPYALQLAHGRSMMALMINLVMVALIFPAMIMLTILYSEIGAALAWLALHVFYLFFGTWVTHRKLLVGLGFRWLVADVGLPLILVMGVAGCVKLIGVGGAPDFSTFLTAALVMLLAPALVSLLVFSGFRTAITARIWSGIAQEVWKSR